MGPKQMCVITKPAANYKNKQINKTYRLNSTARAELELLANA